MMPIMGYFMAKKPEMLGKFPKNRAQTAGDRKNNYWTEKFPSRLPEKTLYSLTNYDNYVKSDTFQVFRKKSVGKGKWN